MSQHTEIQQMQNDQRCARAEIQANVEHVQRVLERGETMGVDQFVLAVAEYLRAEEVLEERVLEHVRDELQRSIDEEASQ
jgi:hypothetical protein